MNIFEYSKKNIKEILSELDVNQKTGLSEKDLPARLAKYGENTLSIKSVSVWNIFFRQFKSAFIYLLIGAIIISAFLGEMTNAIMIFLFLVINAILGFLQEYHSEKTVQLLNKYALPRTRVLRSGLIKEITANHIVVGDIIYLETGDKVPADIRILEENSLIIDETILTGESISVYKREETLADTPTSYHQALNLVFSGTSVISGKAKAIVLSVGKDTAFGHIAQLTGESKKNSDFEKGISNFSRFVLKLVALTLLLLFAAHLIIKPGGINIFELMIFSVALTISVIPEALPLVTTFSLARGARRLARKKVIVKRLSAIEDLGGIEVLCSDKTGTLTKNELEIVNIYAKNKEEALYFANLASAFELEKRTESFDLALEKGLSEENKNLLKTAKKISEIPFDPKIKKNIVLVQNNLKNYLITRGALESILPLCDSLDEGEKKKIMKWASKEGKLGHRTLAIACRNLHVYSDKIDLSEITKNNNFTFSGIVSFQDPIKETTINAVSQAASLGVKIVIITGDSPEVAGAVAKEIGLIDNPELVLTGDEWSKENIDKQKELLNTYRVFARVSPEQKFNIIKSFREDHLVGFLGEGINDAPALKISGVSLVVDSASDIAREAADIILLQNNLEVIISGIREGRRVFANTTKYIKSTLASNFGNFFAVATASLLINYLPMLPIQILLLNLLSDTPMISISTDNVDEKELKSPKKYEANEIIIVAVIFGLISTIFDFLFFSIFFKMEPRVLQTNWFIASILTELVLVFSIRTKSFFLKTTRPSRSILFLSFIITFITITLPYTNFGQLVFKFTPPRLEHLLLIFGIVVVYFIFTETAKLFYYRRKNV